MELTSKSIAPASDAPGVFVSTKDMGMAELGDAFRKLTEITPRLNRATDAANAAYRTTEEILTKLGIGIDAEVDALDLSDETEQNEESGMLKWTSRKLRLTYERIGAKYRLGFKVIKERHFSKDGNPDDFEFLGAEIEELTVWDNAGRLWKLAGIAALAELITTIAEKAEELSASAEAAGKMVNSILRDLEKIAAAGK